MKRRTLLAGCGTVLAGLLAGCGSGGSDAAEATPTDTPEATPTPQEVSLGTAAPTETPTATPEPTPTPTPEPTPEPTPTPTPTPAGNVHQVGERFTVGSGSNAITYRVNRFYTADMLGNAASRETADGTFLVVVMDLSNPREKGRFTFPRDSFRVQSSATWHSIDRNATDRIGVDDRLEVESMTNRFVDTGQTLTGAVAFDVNPDSSYRVWILPAGDASTPEHFVPIGAVSSVQPL